MQSEKECFACKTQYNLHNHHIFYGSANRKQSEKYGLKIWLCARHHNMSNEGIHFNKDFDEAVKKMAQTKFEETHSREDFRRIFGKSFI